MALGLTIASSAQAAEVGDAPGRATIDRTGYVEDGSRNDDAPTMVGDVNLGASLEAQPNEATVAVSPQIRLGMRPRPEVELHLDFGAVAIFREGPEGRQQEARPSNLSFGASRVLDRRGDRWRYAKVGFAFVIPTGFASSPLEQDAYEYALAGRVGWDPWAWVPQTLGLVVPAEVRAQLGRRWVLGADGALAALLPSAGITDGPAVAAQVAGEARFVTRWMGLGMRMTAAWNGRHPEDRSQAGVSPFVDASLCRRRTGRRVRGQTARTSSDCPLYALASLNVNVDGPYGFMGRESTGIWGMQFGLGWAVY
ncbi:MAG: hypothetical protein AAF799_37010 [Myxococcota bacterium]